MKKTLLFIFTLLISYANTQVTTIDFETLGSGYTPSATHGSGFMDVFNRSNPNIGGNSTYIWSVEDMILTNPSIDLEQIDISGSTDFTFSIDMIAHHYDDWDVGDWLEITYIIDGGSVENLMWVKNTGECQYNTVAALDINFDGIGENSNLLPSLTTGTDTNNGNPPCNSGNVVSIDTFETFTSSTILLSNNSTLNILLQFNGMDAGDEGIYLDNIIITETVGSPIIADQLVFTSIPTNADNVIPFTLEVCATNGTSTQTTYTDSIYLSQILGDSSTITQTQTINGCATFTIIPNYSGDTLSFYTSSGTLTNDSTGNIIVNTPPNTNGALLVNEFSNGVSGTKEYIELLVLGDPSNPLDNVDLTGWIIDDNNGDFKAGTGSGIKPGHIRLTSSLNSVPPGSIILIYNIEDKNTSITQLDDPLDLINPDGVYIIPANDTTTLESTTLGGTPNSTISTYAGNTYIKPDSSTWEDRISYRNGGDAAIVVSPDFVLFHGLSYGDNDSIVTNGVFTDSLSGTGKVYSLLVVLCMIQMLIQHQMLLHQHKHQV